MEAHPEVGDAYRQELLLDEAEDFARVLRLEKEVNVPYGSFHGCLETTETSGVEPRTMEYIFYAPGVGLVYINDISGNQKAFLVKITSE